MIVDIGYLALTFIPCMQEVEKEVTDDADGGQQQAGAGGRGKAPSSRGGVKKRTVTELEYVYDHEMEGEASGCRMEEGGKNRGI